MHRNGRIFIFLLCILLISVLGCAKETEPKEDRGPGSGKLEQVVTPKATPTVTVMPESTEALVATLTPEPEPVKHANSLFSWYFELTDGQARREMLEAFSTLEITRVYQCLSVERLQDPEVEVMVRELAKNGIETVFLTGDTSWLQDGLTELHHVVDSLTEYNSRVPEEAMIRKVALDVEVHTVAGWKQNQNAYFEEYVELMREAKQYAEQNGIGVIQVIPTMFDIVNQELFAEFLQECCDEITVMNYGKKSMQTAISGEVAMAAAAGIPIESVMETSPVNRKQGVSERNTFFYDGVDAMLAAADAMREVYGESMGIGFHYATVLYHMVTAKYPVHLYPVEQTGDGDSVLYEYGKLLLTGSDGSYVVAYPYWKGGKRNKENICFLAMGLSAEVEYSLVYYDRYKNIRITEPLVISPEEDQIWVEETFALE